MIVEHGTNNVLWRIGPNAVTHVDHVVNAGDHPLGKQKPRDQITVVARSAHRHRQRGLGAHMRIPVLEDDLEWLFHSN